MKFTFLLPNVEINGGNRATFELANALVGLGHNVNIIYPLIPGRDGQPWWRPRKTLVQIVKGVRNFLFRGHWMPIQADTQWRWYFGASLALPKADFLIVTWWAHVDLALGQPVASGRPVHYMRSLEFWGGPEAEVRRSYQQGLPRFATSESLKDQFEAQFDSVRAVIPDGVSNAFSPIKNASTSDALVVGMMYRRQPLKRMADGLRAIQKLQASTEKKINVMLFGERMNSTDKRSVSQLANCKHVLFPTGQHLIELYSQLDLFLFPSGPEEAFGLPPLEAMACGTAVVSTRVGAIADFAIDNQSVLFCEPGDIDVMSQQMRRLIEDEGLRLSLVEQGLRVASRYRWEGSAEQLVTALLKL